MKMTMQVEKQILKALKNEKFWEMSCGTPKMAPVTSERRR